MTASQSPPPTTRPLALVVDDFPDGRDVTCCVLVNIGFRTLEAANGHDALQQARECRPELIVLDLALPGIDGWEVARRLRSDPATAQVPILGFTAHAESGPLARAREAGCDAVLTKPCPPRELIDGVRRLMGELASTKKRRSDGGESA